MQLVRGYSFLIERPSHGRPWAEAIRQYGLKQRFILLRRSKRTRAYDIKKVRKFPILRTLTYSVISYSRHLSRAHSNLSRFHSLLSSRTSSMIVALLILPAGMVGWPGYPAQGPRATRVRNSWRPCAGSSPARQSPGAARILRHMPYGTGATC